VIDIREDSEDLTPEEIAQASPVMEMPVEEGACSVCGEPLRKVRHILRRRRPHLYSRLSVVCSNGHPVVKTFRLDFLHEEPL